MKKIIAIISMSALFVLMSPQKSFAEGGIYASGGGNVTEGQTFTVHVTASGAEFDTVHGSISISGPVSVVSFSAGDATWISRPSNGGTFDGAFLGEKKSSFSVASIKLKADNPGDGAVSISNVSLKNAGNVVGTGSSGASFSISKAADLPGAVKVSSTSHPDPNAAYEATTIVLNWTKDKGVDAFSYLLDQSEKTAPPAKTTDANTSITYADKAIGTYYFHIRAHKEDGWGGSTHFKINIKEPDAKIDDKLAKPTVDKIEKMDNFVNNIKDGTVSGLKIIGTAPAGYNLTFTFEPVLILPEGKTIAIKSDTKGKFELPIDFAIKAGRYKLTIQAQLDKILTPISNETVFEISQADGGNIKILTEKDAKIAKQNSNPIVKGSFLKKEYPVMTYLIFTLGLAVIVLVIIETIRYTRRRRNKL